ncbi:glycosyltransferase [Nitrospira lenta]|uniref:Putative Glycosyl transferase, group 1 n=1 Tax=Nitrospira lenta TaxID=1436998 RepID=A0A330LBQ1_9BACT|nr:glycosyltransferase [Nitrospira lenta]SPP66506.1 putative Glycosyl transferase, group 1 [Nitrospira lenta]
MIVVAELAGSASYGGGERYLELLCGHLDPARFRPILICPEPGSFVGRMQRRGVDVRVVHLEPLLNPFALMRLVRVLSQENVTILQTHGARANFYGRVAGWLAGVPVVISTVHNSIADYEVSRLKRWIYSAALRATLPWATRILCVSDAVRRDVIQDDPAAAARTETVHNGVDRLSFQKPIDRTKVRRELGLTDGPLLVTVARLTPPKGHGDLIEALALLRDQWPGLQCVCVGDGELRQPLEELAAARGLSSMCRFVGSRDDVMEFYAAADVVVLPSHSEGFPFVILEALAMGKPVIATSVNGVPEVIDHLKTGLLVKARDVAGLAGAIQSLLEHPERARQLGDAGRAVVQAQFTVDRMVEKTVAVFDAALRTEGVDAPAWSRRVA